MDESFLRLSTSRVSEGRMKSMQYEIKAESRVSISYSLNNKQDKSFRKSRTRRGLNLVEDENEEHERAVSIIMSVGDEMEF